VSYQISQEDGAGLAPANASLDEAWAGVEVTVTLPVVEGGTYLHEILDMSDDVDATLTDADQATARFTPLVSVAGTYMGRSSVDGLVHTWSVVVTKDETGADIGLGLARLGADMDRANSPGTRGPAALMDRNLARIDAATGGGTYTDEQAQDAVGGIVATSSTVALAYIDAPPSIAAAVVNASIGTTQLAADGVTNAKLADMAQGTVKGRALSAGTDNPVDLTATQVKAIVDSVDSGTYNATLAATGGGTILASGHTAGLYTIQPYAEVKTAVTTGFIEPQISYSPKNGGDVADDAIGEPLAITSTTAPLQTRKWGPMTIYSDGAANITAKFALTSVTGGTPSVEVWMTAKREL